MKKLFILSLVAMLSFSVMAAEPGAQQRQPGGIGAACVGCCFGIRTVAAWNEGKNLDIRDILDLLSIGRIWSAISGYQGITATQLHNQAPLYY